MTTAARTIHNVAEGVTTLRGLIVLTLGTMVADTVVLPAVAWIMGAL